jgi:hypothetical protein
MLLSRLTAPAATLPRFAAPRRIVLIRLTVAVAILLFFGAAAVMVLSGPVRQPLAQEDARYFQARLVDFDQAVRTRLVRIRPDATGLVSAQNRTREALTAINALALGVDRTKGPDAELLSAAMADEVRFLDAVGSVLVNPRSPRLAELPTLDVAARRSIAAVIGPRAKRTGGVAALQRLRGAGGRKPARTAA